MIILLFDRVCNFSTSGHIVFSDRISLIRLVVNSLYHKNGDKFSGFFVRFYSWHTLVLCAIVKNEFFEQKTMTYEEKVISMPNQLKYNQILDALQELLKKEKIQTISVSEIAQTAGIGKGSIYYYFPSKDAILDALVERNYEKPLQTAKDLADQTDISPFTRMAMIFQACRNSSSEFLKSENHAGPDTQERSFLHQKYINHIITELKPVLAEIIRQGIQSGEIHFENPEALAEIVLIVLTVKIDNTLIPSSKEEIDSTISALISLLEKGTGNPPGSLNFLKSRFG